MSDEKTITKIKALLNLSESEKDLGNYGAATSIAAKAQQLMIKHKIEQDLLTKEQPELVYVQPKIERQLVFNKFLRVNARSNLRMAWWEYLTETVAENYFCKAGVLDNGSAYFYGLEFDRELAIFVFEALAESADKICSTELKKARELKSTGAVGGIRLGGKKTIPLPNEWSDEEFIDSFHFGFRTALDETYKEHKGEIKVSIAVEEFFNRIDNSVRKAIQYNNLLYAVDIGKQAGTKVSNKKVANKSGSAALIKQMKKKKESNPNSVRIGTGVGEIYVLIDTSGSMSSNWGEDKLEQAKIGSIEFAEMAINKGNTIGLIEFATNANHKLAPTHDLEKFKENVNALSASGGTNLYDALKQALFRMSRKDCSRTILVATDGYPSSKDRCLTLADEIKRSGITIMAIGTTDVDQEFLDKLTSAGKNLLSDNFSEGFRKMAGMLSA